MASVGRRGQRFGCTACAGAGVLGDGWWNACVVWFNFTARPPPPVILPAAPGASLGLAGALRRASPFGLALPPAVGEGWWSCLRMEGREKRRDMGRSRRVSDNRQDSNNLRLARAPRGALRGLRLQALPATFATRPVRRSPVSCLFPRPGTTPTRLRLARPRPCVRSTVRATPVCASPR
jgi:hypothetical protein